MDDVSAFLQLMRTVPRDWRAAIDRRLAPLGLSQAKWQPLIYLLRAEGPPTQAEIARHLDIESPTLVRLLDRLEADGWIERHHCPGDRRARRIHLTEHARRHCAEIEASIQQVRRLLLAEVSGPELRGVLSVLTRVQAATERLAQADAASLDAPPAEPLSPVARRAARPAKR